MKSRPGSAVPVVLMALILIILGVLLIPFVARVASSFGGGALL